jgi:hypothetical protein
MQFEAIFQSLHNAESAARLAPFATTEKTMTALPRVIIENFIQNPPRSTPRELVAAFEQLPMVSVVRPNTAYRRITMTYNNASYTISEKDLDNPIPSQIWQLQDFAARVGRDL